MSATLPLTIKGGIKGVGFVPRPTSWLPCTKGNSASRTPHHGSLVQRELSAAWQTEGLSVRLPIYYIENRPPLSPPSLCDTSPYISVSLNFFGEKI